MSFHTGPGGAESLPSLHSEEEDAPTKKQQETEGARKSSRASKGRNPMLEREDEVVDIPKVKGKAATPVASKSKPVTSTPTTAASTPPATVKSATTPTVKPAPTPTVVKPATTAAKPALTPAAKPAAAITEAPASPSTPIHGRSVTKSTSSRTNRKSTDSQDKTRVDNRSSAERALKCKSDASPPRDESLPEFHPDKFTPGYVPSVVKKGTSEYMIVVSGVKDTGLCGGYWGNTENLGSRRQSKPPESLQLGQPDESANRRVSVGRSVDTTYSKKQVTKPKKLVESMESSQSEVEADTVNTNKGVRVQKRKNEYTPPATQVKKAKTTEAARQPKLAETKSEEEEDLKASFSDYDSGDTEPQPLLTTRRPSAKAAQDSPVKNAPLTNEQQTAVSAASMLVCQPRSVSCVADPSTQREVAVECFAPYDEHRWVNIGKERGIATDTDALQYARALRPPYHLLSFLRIKGHCTKGMTCTGKNTMVFVVMEGEISVILHTTQFTAKKGDSFYIPPKNYYNLINQKVMEAELSLMQFQYEGLLHTPNHQ